MLAVESLKSMGIHHNKVLIVGLLGVDFPILLTS